MSELLFTNKSDLVAIADKIKAKAGVSGGISFPQGFIDTVDAISGQGGSGDGGVEDGYSATFYDEEDVAFLSLSIRQGLAINEPAYGSKSWNLEDGTVITFPYYPTSDISVYAYKIDNVGKLYEHFGLNINTYPYLLVNLYQNQYVNLFFSKQIKTNTTSYLELGGTSSQKGYVMYRNFKLPSAIEPSADSIDYLIDYITATFTSLNSDYSYAPNFGISNYNSHTWTNFDYLDTNTNKFDMVGNPRG